MSPPALHGASLCRVVKGKGEHLYMNAVMSDLRLYRRLIVMQVRAQLQYKINVVVDIFTYLGITSLEFLTMLIYFVQFPAILGWHIGEVAMLAAVTSVSFGLAELFGAGIDDFDETIRRGDFDRVLLRPLSALILVVSSDFRLRRLGRITEGMLAFVVGLALLHGIDWTPLKALALLMGVVSGALIFVSVLLLGATMCFWTVQTTELINSLYYGGREMLSYPITIYHQALQRILLFVVPLAFGSYMPTCYLLNRALPLNLPVWVVFLSPLAGLAFASVAVWLWGFGVRHYQSTGS
jgi:ABC-2 type transport system permease protein